MLPRLAHPTATTAFAMLRLLRTSDQAKDTEILALPRRITVLERQLGNARARFCVSDRAFSAALPHRLPSAALRGGRLPARPCRVGRFLRESPWPGCSAST
ncbi:hypothetical protein [Streptomyces chiangmaiensis]|uniref:Transposase n=1 Tax=Streptomyces chiangmaiensis TaxID=766497 RepID=A0ABU7FFN8_9ACTN|nr:hypothetical protein [Streptomyces chiangmaiensis]MED7822951.1 hypothetical protein [Streptomyces chiangmaiensis]